MMATAEKQADAVWCDDEKWYIAYRDQTGDRNIWFSADGDDWVDEVGRPINGSIFDSVTIRLVGGPRNGVVVA